MADRYSTFVNAPVLRSLASSVGLPQPVELDRYKPGDPVVKGRVLVGEAPDGRLTNPVADVLRAAEVEVAGEANGDGLFKGLVFDAIRHQGLDPAARALGLLSPDDPPRRALGPHRRPRHSAGGLREPARGDAPSAPSRASSAPSARRSAAAPPPNSSTSPRARRTSSRPRCASCFPRARPTSPAQVVRIGAGETEPDIDWRQPLAGRVALVTGASRGIGKSIAQTLARDGAHVIGLDIPQLSDDLDAVAKEISGSTLTLDVTDEATPKAIADHLEAEHGGIDVVVHNAGVTRDKTLGRMDDERWDMLMEINLSSEERINDELLSRKLLRPNGRIVCVSSMSGIAGNAGQTNYATSKAGVIGMVQSMAPSLAEHKATINAVAPGFIETQMTAAMPVPTREAGRRMNSMSQGGLPVDVAETIAWFASPASGGVNGNVVRVCGQSLLGA